MHEGSCCFASLLQSRNMYIHMEKRPFSLLLQADGGLDETVTEVSYEKRREKTAQNSPAGKVFPPGESRRG